MGRFIRVPSMREDGHRMVKLAVRKQDIPANVELVAGYIVENNERAQAVRRQRAQLDPERVKKGLKIVGIIAAGLLSLQLVTATKQYIEIENVPINGVYYEIDDPSQASWALANAYGQELMTNVANLSKEQRENLGIVYSPPEQATREQRSISNQEEFTQLQADISSNMAVLKNPDATQEEIKTAIINLKTATDRIDAIMLGKEPTLRASASGFEDNARVIPDDRTDSEIAVKDKIVADYYAEYGLSQSNVDFINDLYTRAQNGEEIAIDSVIQELDGDFVITGESAREVVKEQKLRGISAILQHFKNAFSRDKDQNIDGER